MRTSPKTWILAAAAAAGFAAGTALHPVAWPADWRLGDLIARAGSGDPGKAAARAAGRCAGLAGTDARDCYERFLVPIARARGPKAALDALTRLTALDHGVLVIAHDYAHAIGVASYLAHPDVARIFPECSVDFQSGCYHGVIQAYFMRRGADDSASVRALCVPFIADGAYGWLRFQCAHGMGHGLTMLLDHDLPAALAKCDYLADGWDRESCYGGAFMENVVSASQPAHDMGLGHGHDMMPGMRMDGPKFKQVDRTDPTYPCSVLADRYQAACWENQASVIEFITDWNVARAAAGCDRAPSKFVRWCYIGLGTDFNGKALSDPAQALAMCDRTNATWREWCYVGAAKNLVEVGAQPAAGMRFCALVTRAPWKMRCYEGLGEEISSVTDVTTERERYCRESEAPYVEACRYGARVRADRPPGLTAPD
ncbi:MAG TPA: hypothetical protein VMT93_07515 [Gemmatimonadaceae bacterium]|nr:hypothetical protein [Gemmatimonadaceae bacterium]